MIVAKYCNKLLQTFTHYDRVLTTVTCRDEQTIIWMCVNNLKVTEFSSCGDAVKLAACDIISWIELNANTLLLDCAHAKKH